MPEPALEKSNSTNSTLSTHNAQLSDVQRQVIASIAQGHTITAAAAAASIHRTTIHIWLKSAAFNQALQNARNEYRAQLKDYLQELSGVALDTVRAFLQDPQISASVRLRAALSVLGRNGWNLPGAEFPLPNTRAR